MDFDSTKGQDCVLHYLDDLILVVGSLIEDREVSCQKDNLIFIC